MKTSEPRLSEVRLYRFGPYELDLERNELRKFGLRVKLEPKPQQVLAALLDRSGEVVTRSELRQLLWGDGVFVDFEKGLTVAATKLRAALNDSSENPKYIATVAGEGYQFIAAVEKFTSRLATAGASENRNSNSDHGVSAATSLSALESGPPADLETINPEPTPSTRTLVGAWKIVFAGILLLAGLLAFKQYRSRAPAQLSEKNTIVIADFVNSTGDPAFDDTLKTTLTIALNQSTSFHVVSEPKVRATLQLMTQSQDTKLSPDVARQVCQRSGSKVYIDGSISSLGTEYVVRLRAVDCESAGAVAEEQVTASAKERVLPALGQGASRLRRELGESLRSVRQFNVPLEKATTPSLEALKAFSLARLPGRANGDTFEIEVSDFKRAVELDPGFATAYLLLGEDYDDNGASELAERYYKKAFELRSRASDPERLAIEVAYYGSVTGELERAALTIQQQIDTYPWSLAEYGDASFVYTSLGQYEKAMELTRLNLHFDPENLPSLVNIGNYALALQHFDQARQMTQDALAHKIDNHFVRSRLYAFAFLNSDKNGMLEQQKWFASRLTDENIGLGMASDTEAYAGHLNQARQLTMASADSAIRTDNPESAATNWTAAAIREAAFGNVNESRRLAEKGLQLCPKSRSAQALAGLAYAMATQSGRAESVTRNLANRWPLDTQIQRLWLPTIQAQLALDRKDPREALTLLDKTSAFELGLAPGLFSIYVRGQAYLATGNGAAAATEFQKILVHSGIVVNCWTGALAHLGLARANILRARALRGTDADAARIQAFAAYKDFLDLWKDADPDIPILKQAKAEYAKLQ